MQTLRLLSAIVLAMFASSCSTAYMLTTSFVANTQEGKTPDVVETTSYKNAASAIKTVALRAPDSCSNRTSDQTSGNATSQSTILQTSCGVEMAMIEKNLTKNGYRVISWKALATEMGKNQSATVSAASLGAEALFQINSLESSKKTLGKDARWERRYYRTDGKGRKKGEQSFDEETRNFFKANFLSSYENRINLKRLAVTIDATVVLVKTGESIWFYTWTAADSANLNFYDEVFVECDSSNRVCERFTPAVETEAKKNVNATGDSEAVSVSEKPEDRDKAVYDKLLGIVIDSLVKSFSQKS